MSRQDTNKEVIKIIRQVMALAKNKCNSENFDLENFEKFIHAYYRSVAIEELEARPVEELLGIAASHWASLAKRKPGQVVLNVYNPSIKKEGWSSKHTVIQLTQDDMPFLIDTMVMELNRLGINMHFILHTSYFRVLRNNDGEVTKVLDLQNPEEVLIENAQVEAPVYIEIDRQEDKQKTLESIRNKLLEVLGDVRLAVQDYSLMRNVLISSVEDLRKYGESFSKESLDETVDFLTWLDNNHFTYLGYAEFLIEKSNLMIKSEKSLGVAKNAKRFQAGVFLGESSFGHCLNSGEPILVAKSDFQSNVHRRGRMDVIVTPLYDPESGKTIGERRFVGLFTSVAYHSNPLKIPLIRRKANLVLQEAGFDENGHAGKALVNILQTFPRDELFHIDHAQLLKIVLDILNIQERQQVRLFIIQDSLHRYYSCMIYLPRDVFNTDLRLKIQHILMQELAGEEVEFEPVFFESSILCRIDLLIHTLKAEVLKPSDIKALEHKLIIAARDWRDDLRAVLIEQEGEHDGAILFSKYARSFPAGYRETFFARQAASDIVYMEKVLSGEPVGMFFYRLLEESDQHIRFKLFQKSEPIPLTLVLPILENMGLAVLEERPYEIKLGEENIWISDFGMRVSLGSLVHPEEVALIFQEAFSNVWEGRAENDGFNRLVMRAGLSWREINILRSYAKYLLQIGFLYSQTYIEETLTENPELSRDLVKLFLTKFDPNLNSKQRDSLLANAKAQILKLLEQVKNLDRDRILRRFLEVINATVRTNYFQKDEAGLAKEYLSFKLQSDLISNMPKPLPMFEIFVCSRRMEGVHLRGSKVARGGLRWSDRREDFRREVLGLLKAQQVKNAVIVPFGAKGGFILKCPPNNNSRDDLMAEGIACYKTFIRGMLDITDNRQGQEIITPKEVIKYDGDDPYFVVAADKGTASFSDIANSVAKEYGFWLGDAFASGGSNGYDHKKMGITARGAWESAKRHFLSLGKNILKENFTCVGIGDMSGDVFGNGMLLSEHIQLVAAFNHQHIFIDPEPVAKTSFIERQRLFNLPRSTWLDYKSDLISPGGGVFERSAKSIDLSPEIQKLLKLKVKKIEPNLLIQELLKLKVELLYNGGIGTYIKASTENHFMLGDRANDEVRVDAIDLKAKVIVEGGNVGVTQLARIEYAQKGGLIYTDAIDNSGGVDCSDHEVNIKILLADAIENKALKLEDRNELLATMKDEIADLVLSNNYHQTQAINNMLSSAPDILYMQLRLIRELEREGFLDRKLEFLPSDKEIKARFANNQGLCAPELAVLMAYSKSAVKGEIFHSDLPDESYFDIYIAAEFPKILRERFSASMRRHYLAREIIVTQLTNEMLQQMGFGFVHRLYDETGATPAMIARAYVIAKEICDLPEMWTKIEALDGKVEMAIQQDLMREVVRLVRRVARWLLQQNRQHLEVPSLIKNYAPKVQEVRQLMSKFLSKEERYAKKEAIKKYTSAGVPNELALRTSDYAFMPPMMDIILASDSNHLDLKTVAEVYYKLSEKLELSWFRQSVDSMRAEGYWGTLASSGLRDDMDRIQRFLTTSVILTTPSSLPIEERVESWMASFRFTVNRWLYMVENLKSSKHEFIMYLVAIRGLVDLSETCSKRCE